MCPNCSCPGCQAARDTRSDWELLSEITDLVALRYHTTRVALLSPIRTQRVSLARMIAFHLARNHTGLSYPAIGRFFRHDHTTVIHGVNKIGRMMLERPMFAAEMQRIRGQLELGRRKAA